MAERAGYALVVGVNRAARVYGCDWWSIGDAEAFAEVEPVGSPHIWTHVDTLHRIRREHPVRSTRHDSALYRRDERLPWTIFSATAALMLAVELRVKRVDCFGVDMVGECDWDGTRRGVRGEDRWTRERRAWSLAVNKLNDAGIAVVRT
jgi:hypothetical protein